MAIKEITKRNGTQISDTWLRIKLGKLCNITSGYAFDSRYFGIDGIPLIRIRDLKTNSPETRYSGLYREEYLIKKGALLIGMDGEFRCIKWHGPDALLNQRVCHIKADKKCVDESFLHYFINPYLKIIENETSFTTVKHISSKQILDIDFLLPNLIEQKRIVSVLDEKNAAVERAKKAVENQMEDIRALRAAYLGEVFSTAGEKLPKGWQKLKVKDFSIVATGGTPSTNHPEYYDGNIPWMRSGDIKSKDIYDIPVKISQIGVNNSNAKLLPEGSVMIALSGQGKTRGTCGILRLASACSQSVAAILPTKIVLPEIIYYNLLTQYQAIRRITGDSERTGLNLKIVNNLEIYVPPINEQLRIAERLDKVYVELTTIEKNLVESIESIDQLPQTYLQRALKGELV